MWRTPGLSKPMQIQFCKMYGCVTIRERRPTPLLFFFFYLVIFFCFSFVSTEKKKRTHLHKMMRVEKSSWKTDQN